MVIQRQWKNLNLIHHHLKKPLKQECITAHYLQHDEASLYLNHDLLQSGKKLNRLNYIFQTNNFLGLNITFMRFVMSHMCFVSHPYLPDYLKKHFHGCVYNEWTEYIKLDKHKDTENNDLFFCMKRPLWSVYSTSNTNMEYNLCQQCMNHETSIIFNYQILDTGLLHTYCLLHLL